MQSFKQLMIVGGLLGVFGVACGKDSAKTQASAYRPGPQAGYHEGSNRCSQELASENNALAKSDDIDFKFQGFTDFCERYSGVVCTAYDAEGDHKTLDTYDIDEYCKALGIRN